MTPRLGFRTGLEERARGDGALLGVNVDGSPWDSMICAVREGYISPQPQEEVGEHCQDIGQVRGEEINIAGGESDCKAGGSDRWHVGCLTFGMEAWLRSILSSR